MTPASQVEVHVDGQSSGVAFLSASPGGTELSVIGKLSFVLLEEGQAAIVARPEPPGLHRGVAAPAELDEASAGLLLVAGPRVAGGRIVLRRGTTVLAEVGFLPGLEPLGVTASGLQVVSGPDAATGEADEWLVIEGVTAPEARRWCKLPKMRLVASWEPAAELVLGSRACFIDLTTWTVSFLLRGTLSLATPAPRVVMVSVEDTFVSSVRERTTQSPETLPSQDGPMADDDDEGVRTAVRGPALAAARALEDAPTDEQKTRLVQIPVQLPPEALPESSTRRGGSRRNVRGARAGLRLGPVEPPRPKALLLDEETTMVATLETAPTSVTHAFAALSPEVSASTATRAERVELLRRIRSGEPLDGLDLRGAVLAGLTVAGASLVGLDLSSADLRGANLAGTDLRGARLDGAQLDGARLDGANLDGASLVGASLRSVALAGASFVGADLSNAEIGSTHPDSAFAGAKLDAIRRV